MLFALSSAHPGTSEHPSSHPAMWRFSSFNRASSPKPLPTHSRPLRPLDGRLGPKAAGRAKKKVELSLVRLMTAEGGNREEGVENENRARRRLGLGPPLYPALKSGGLSVANRDQQVSAIGTATKNISNRRNRNGRMFVGDRHSWSGGCHARAIVDKVVKLKRTCSLYVAQGGATLSRSDCSEGDCESVSESACKNGCS